MSLEYCHDCDRMIELDYDLEHEHFNDNEDKEVKNGKDNKLC